MLKQFGTFLMMAWLVLCAGQQAQASGGAAAAAPVGVQYVDIDPPILVNYGGPGRIKYLKLEMSVRVGNGEVAGHIKHNMPLIRNNLILLFSKQTEEAVSSGEGKEAMRQQALAEVRAILEKETGITEVKPEPVAHEGEEAPPEEEEKPKAKDKHAKDKGKAKAKDAEPETKPAVEDLLFNNFIVQR